jgi:hypothetical protein
MTTTYWLNSLWRLESHRHVVFCATQENLRGGIFEVPDFSRCPISMFEFLQSEVSGGSCKHEKSKVPKHHHDDSEEEDED